MPLNRLIAYLDLNKTGFDAGLDKAGKNVNKFGGDIKRQLAGAFSAAAILSFTKSTIEAVSKIADMSQEIGISAESMQELEYAAKLTGANVESIVTAFKALSKARSEALTDPKSKAAQGFGAMGIDSAALKSDSIEKIFKRIAETVRTTDFGATELAIVSELLGRSGSDLIPMFKAGIEGAAAEARNLGIILSDEVVAQVDAAGDAMDRLTLRLRGPVASAIGFVADRISEIVDLFDIAIGGWVAFWGGIMGSDGGVADRIQSGIDAATSHVTGVLDRRIQEENAAAQQVNPADNREKKIFNFASKDSGVSAIGKIQSDQFQKIGAFTGAAGASAQDARAMRALTYLEQIKAALTSSGIIVKGTD